MSEDGRGKGHHEEHEHNSGFEDIFAKECEKVRIGDDIDVRTSGYTRSGNALQMVIRMHEYTF